MTTNWPYSKLTQRLLLSQWQCQLPTFCSWGHPKSAHKSSEVETSEDLGLSLDTWSTTKRSSSSLAICLVPHDCHLHHWLSAQWSMVINREPCIAFSLQRCPASPAWLWAIHQWAFYSSSICKSIRICLAQGDVKFVIRWGAQAYQLTFLCFTKK